MIMQSHLMHRREDRIRAGNFIFWEVHGPQQAIISLHTSKAAVGLTLL